MTPLKVALNSLGTRLITLFKRLRLLGILASVITALVLLTQCDKTDPTMVNNNGDVTIDSVNWLHGGVDEVPIDLDEDGVSDVVLHVTANTAASGSSWSNGKIYTDTNKGIEFLADSFTYHYCCDTCTIPNDTLIFIRYYNCTDTSPICNSPTRAYTLALPDSIRPSGIGFYLADTSKLYRQDHINPVPSSFPCTGYNFTRSEGTIQKSATLAYIYLRWSKSGTMHHYAIETKWTVPYLYIKRVLKY